MPLPERLTSPELLGRIERAFPYIARPPQAELPFHKDGCASCEVFWRHMVAYADARLSAPAIRYLCDEWATLSSAAVTWILPSYLRHILTAEDDQDPRPTEYLIYNLGPSPEHAEDTRLQLSLLTAMQLDALAAVLEHLNAQPYWNDYCGDDLATATAFLETVAQAAGRRTSGCS
jgi:hypothetical protein